MQILRNPATPFAEFEDSFFDPQGLLVTWFARGRVFEDHGVALAFAITETTFTPSWSNPVWSQLEYDVNTEAARIMKLVTSVAEALPPPHNDALALVHPGPLFDAKPKIMWYGRIGCLLAATTASAVCLACAFTVEPMRGWMEACWERCANLIAAEAGAGADPIVVVPVASEQFILVGGGVDSNATSSTTPLRRS